MEILRYCRPVVFLPLVLATAGCGVGLGTVSTLGSLAELFRPGASGQAPQQVQIVAEVQDVDMRQQLIQVTTPDGRAGGVTYDLGTSVAHGQQAYAIAALQPGDIINLQLQQTAPNTLYASRIEVVRLARMETARLDLARADTVRTAADTVTGAQQFKGEIGAIDTERGTFRLHTPDHGTLTVSLPFNPPPLLLERFQTLRSGDMVSVEGSPLSGGRVEVIRFP